MISMRIPVALILAILVLSVLAGVSVLSVAEADDPVVSTQEARAASSSIPLKGLEAQNMGSAAWIVTGAGSEPIHGGHNIHWANIACITFAYYYLASRDYSNIDASAVTGLVGVTSTSTIGFPNLTAALSAGGFSVSDITVSWTPQTLGNDIEGQDWMYDAGSQTETRYYTGGDYTVYLGGAPMIGGSLPRTTMLIDYNDTNDCFDDQISGSTDSDRPQDRSAGSSAAVQAAASAFLQDLGNNGTKFVFDSFQPAGQFQFSGSGRSGGFFEIQVGSLQAASIPVADIELIKSVSDPAPQRGDAVSYTLNVVNNGPATATNVTLRDLLPVGLTFTSAGPPSAGCVNSLQDVDCSLGDLASGASSTVFVNVQVDSNATGSLVNGGFASSTTFDNDGSNNGADVTITVNIPSAVPGITPIGLVGMAGALAVLVGWRLRRTRGRLSRQRL